MTDDENRIPYTAPRVAFYLFALASMLSLGGFADNAAHFGPGFFPLLASFVVVPLLLARLFVDTVMRIVDACTRREFTLASRVMAVVCPAVLLSGSAAGLYAASTA